VTGASGFVGSNLVRALLDTGWQVRTYARHPCPLVPPHAVEHLTGDVRDPDRVAAAVAGVDVAFHLAARITLLHDDPDAWSVNTVGPAVVARAALDHGVARLVHCSSVHAFDPVQSGGHVDERSPRAGSTRPLYDRSKAAGEAAVRAVAADGLDVVIVNPTGIIGPVDVGPSRANGVLLAAARGHLPVAVAGGFDWVDVRDVVDALIAAVDRGEPGENYLLSGHQATALHLARLAAGLNGHVGPLVALPPAVARGIAPLGEAIGRLWGSDDLTPASIEALLDDPLVERKKAEDALGYSPRPLEDTVRDLIWSCRERGELRALRAGRSL